MAITVGVSGGNNSIAAGTTLAVTLSGTPAVGSLILLHGSTWDGVTGVSGAGVTTWTSAMSFTADASHWNQDIWWGIVDGTPSTSITVTVGGTGHFRSATVLEVIGAAQTVDSSVDFGNETGTTDTKSIAPTVDGCLIFSCMGIAGSNTSTVPTGYTGLTAQQSGTTDREQVAYLIQAAHASSSMNWTNLGPGTQNPSLGAIAVPPVGVSGGDVVPVRPEIPQRHFGPF